MPSLMPLWVWIPSTASMLSSISIVKCWKDYYKQNRGADWPIFTIKNNLCVQIKSFLNANNSFWLHTRPALSCFVATRWMQRCFNWSIMNATWIVLCAYYLILQLQHKKYINCHKILLQKELYLCDIFPSQQKARGVSSEKYIFSFGKNVLAFSLVGNLR